MVGGQPKLTPDQLVADVRRHVGHFTQHPYLRLGNADSVHGVMFGDLSNLGPVAVKPFGPNGIGRATAEGKNLERVAKLGLDAIEPLAVAKGGVATYLISRHRPGLRHLGQVRWDVNVASPELKRTIIPTLKDAATTMADRNNMGIFHGDAQDKNMVYDKKTGKPVYTDAEGTHFTPSGKGATEFGIKDVGKFGASTLLKGLLHDRSTSYRVGFLGENLAGPYDAAATYPTPGLQPGDRQRILQDQWTHLLETKQPPSWMIGK